MEYQLILRGNHGEHVERIPNNSYLGIWYMGSDCGHRHRYLCSKHKMQFVPPSRFPRLLNPATLKMGLGLSSWPAMCWPTDIYLLTRGSFVEIVWDWQVPGQTMPVLSSHSLTYLPVLTLTFTGNEYRSCTSIFSDCPTFKLTISPSYPFGMGKSVSWFLSPSSCIGIYNYCISNINHGTQAHVSQQLWAEP